MHGRSSILHPSQRGPRVRSTDSNISAGNTLLLILSILMAASAVAALVAVGFGLFPFSRLDNVRTSFPSETASSSSPSSPLLSTPNDPWSALKGVSYSKPLSPEPPPEQSSPPAPPPPKVSPPEPPFPQENFRAADWTPSGPVHVQAVTFEKAEDGSEIVSIRADGSFVPEVFRLEGENPFGSSLRLVVDVEDAASVADTVSTMDVGARFVKKIRTRFDSRKQKLRTVLDLEPDTPFHVAQTSTSEGRHFAVRLFEGPDPATVEPQDTQEPAEQVSPRTAPPEPAMQAPRRTAPPEPSEPDDGAVRIRAVSYDAGESGERILIQADRFFEPAVFGLEGSNPFGDNLRLVMDIHDALPVLGERSPIQVNGQLVRRIRHNYYKSDRKLRLVLDLAPASGYTAAQTFFKEQNLYCLTLMAEGSGTASKAPAKAPPEPPPTVAAADPTAKTVPDTQADATTLSPKIESAAELVPAALFEHVDPVPPGPEPLRNKGTDLTANDLRALFLHHGFYSTCGAYNTTFCNQDGEFKNDFQASNDRTVCDRATGLMWERKGSDQAMSWQAAGDYIRELNRNRFEGYDDWRLPTLEELLSLMENSWRNGDLFIDEAFEQNQRSCWSADTRGADKAWKAQFHVGYAAEAFRSDRNWVRAVRTIPGPARWAGPPPPAPTPSNGSVDVQHPKSRHTRTSAAGDSLPNAP
jgi:hypothetical protein